VKTVLGGIFGSKEEEVKGRWKMPREELRNVYCLQTLRDRHSREEKLDGA